MIAGTSGFSVVRSNTKAICFVDSCFAKSLPGASSAMVVVWGWKELRVFEDDQLAKQ